MRQRASVRLAGCMISLTAVAACAPTSGRIVYMPVKEGTWTVDQAAEAAEAGAIPVNVPHTRVLVTRIDAKPGEKLPDGAARVVVSNKPGGQKAESTVEFYAITSAVPIESKRILSMAPRRAFTDRTDLKVSYLDGTLIPKSIGTETVDLVKTRIEQIGSVVAAAVPVMGLAGEPSDKPTLTPKLIPFEPFVFDLNEDPVKDAELRPIPSMPTDSGWLYRPSWITSNGGEVSPDPTSVAYETILDRFRAGRDHGFFPSTVCRDLKVTVAYKPNGAKEATDVYTAIVRVADPVRVRLVPLPAKGSLNFHGVCGVDTVDGTRAEPDRLGALEALFKQASLIKAATQPKTP